MFNNTTKHPFRFYYSVPSFSGTIESLQYRFKGCDTQPFRLNSPKDRFLPFQIFIPQSEVIVGDLTATSFEVCDGSGSTIGGGSSYTGNLAQLSLFQVYGKGIWWTYKGDAAFGPTPMSLACGYYYIRITLSSGRKICSEVFYVPSDIELARMITFQWWNETDYSNDYYTGGYKNKIYIESPFHQCQPEIIKEGVENEEKTFFPTKTIYVDNYLMEEYLPLYLMQSLQAIPMNKHIQVYLPSENRTYDVNQIEIVDKESDSCMSLTTIKISLIDRVVNAGNGDTFIQTAVIPCVANNDTVYFSKINSVSVGAVVSIGYNVLNNDSGWNVQVVNTSFGVTSSGNLARVKSDGTLEYKKQSGGASNPSNDTFIYSITDALGNISTGLIFFYFININAFDDILSFSFPSPPGNISIPVGLTQSILNNDSFPFGSNITVVNTPINSILSANGNTIVINADGSFTFNLTGNTSAHKYSKFMYTIKDVFNNTSSAYVKIQIDWGGTYTVPPVGW